MTDRLVAAVRRALGYLRARFTDRIGVTAHWHVECIGADGSVKWVEDGSNLVVDTGLNAFLDYTLKGSGYTAAWYVGLTASAPTAAAGDTMSSHAGWTENVTYSESVRQTLTLGSVASKTVNNSGSKAAFSINGTTTVGGAFVTSISTKSGTTGTLLNIKAFSADRSAISGDTLNVTVTYTAS